MATIRVDVPGADPEILAAAVTAGLGDTEAIVQTYDDAGNLLGRVKVNAPELEASEADTAPTVDPV